MTYYKTSLLGCNGSLDVAVWWQDNYVEYSATLCVSETYY